MGAAPAGALAATTPAIARPATSNAERPLMAPPLSAPLRAMCHRSEDVTRARRERSLLVPERARDVTPRADNAWIFMIALAKPEGTHRGAVRGCDSVSG